MNISKLTGFVTLMVLLGLGSCSKTGPAGPQGEQGPQGSQGDRGGQGIPGADGSTIFSGKGAPGDDLGENGDYYLDKSASNLYGPKTEDGWGTPLHLKGEKGAAGEKGDKGDKGEQGEKGDKGDSGKNGKDGKDGRDGQDGSQILSGNSKPGSSVGNVGDYYWDVPAYTLYGPKTASGWGEGVVLRGPKGEKGDPGNAKVLSKTYQPGNIEWFSNQHDGTRYRVAELSIKQITSNVVQNGVVLVYGDINFPGTKWIIFPIVFPLNGTTYNFMFGYETGKVTLRFFLGNNDSPPAPRIPVRIVIIPGTAIARRNTPPPDPKDYKATCAYYGIPE